MDQYIACSIIEGFDTGENATTEQTLRAWAFLIKTGKVWRLQGSYGRGATELIQGGFISPKGQIHWKKYNALKG